MIFSGIFPISEGLRIVGRSLRVRARGFREYSGSARTICKQIVNDCWNGNYFQASAGHFKGFWTRDFGWCVDSLLKLGWKKQVRQTLAHALKVFSKTGRVTTSITPEGKAFDFARFAPDSLPFLFHALNAAKAKSLVSEHQAFLEEQVKDYARRVIGSDGLVAGKKFSSMRDGLYREKSCYDVVMVGLLARELDRARVEHELPYMDDVLLEKYWNKKFFLDDLSGKNHVAGDAQVFPFWTGVIRNKGMLRDAFESVQNEGLDSPFPLKYVSYRVLADEFWQKVFVPNYEGNTVWAHMGPLYVQLLRKIDKQKAKQHLEAYKTKVEEHKTFLELYSPDGRPYKSFFYVSDEGMLWAANLLALMT